MPKYHGLNEFKGEAAFCKQGHTQENGDRFGRIFPTLPALYVNPETVQTVGKKNGPMDEGAPSADNRTQTVDVGVIFFGQFLDHDITLDTTSSLSSNADVGSIDNVRTPRLDLDSIYGDGPEATPYLYQAGKDNPFAGVKLLIGADADASDIQSSDLARSSQGIAIIGDHRNDENRIISQLQLAMIRFHNAVVDKFSDKYAGKELFEMSRKTVTWHYQWAVVNDYLPDICGKSVVDRILGAGRQLYCPADKPFIPIEFSVAAYRFGHSMIPQRIQIQKNGSLFELFGTALGRGFSPLSDCKAAVDWEELFDNGQGRDVQKSEKLDLKLASDLLKLPFIKPPAEPSLAVRNILRGQAFLLPSGEAVAKSMGREQSEIDTVSSRVKSLALGELDAGSPLWLYILAEAEVIGRETTAGQFDPGEGLGPIGATLVAETIIGLIELDPDSWLGNNRNWTPDAHENGLGLKTVGSILTYAGKVPCIP